MKNRVLLLVFGIALSASNALANTATLTWPPLPASWSITQYTVYKSTTPGTYGAALGTVLPTSLDSNGNVFFVDTIPNDQKYYYVVTATNSAGEGPRSNEVVAAPLLPPAPNVSLNIVTTATLSINKSTVMQAAIGQPMTFGYTTPKKSTLVTLTVAYK